MAEKQLYLKLEKYNDTIGNDFRGNWGSLLTYLPGSDTNILCQASNNVKMEEHKLSAKEISFME